MNKLLAVLALASGVVITGADLRAARTNPVPLETPSPGYPASLTDTGKSGQAVVQMTITTEGHVTNAVLHSADDPAFGKAALAVVAGWRFAPATLEGVPVESRVALPFQFRAPVDQQFNAMLGRKVFVDLPADTKVYTREEYGEDLRPLRQTAPQMPRSLQGRGVVENVRVRFVVDPEGNVINPEVMGEVKHPELVGPALALVATWKYPPPVKNKQPAYVRLSTRLSYAETPVPPVKTAPAGKAPPAKAKQS
jgi:TonB family protein